MENRELFARNLRDGQELKSGEAEAIRRVMIASLESNPKRQGVVRDEKEYFTMLERTAKISERTKTPIVGHVINDDGTRGKIEIQSTMKGNDGVVYLSLSNKKQIIAVVYDATIPGISSILVVPDYVKQKILYYEIIRGTAEKVEFVDEITGDQINKLIQGVNNILGFNSPPAST